MRDTLEQRLADLKTELDKGRAMLEELDQQRTALQQQLLRISGAAQVLEELLAQPAAPVSIATAA